MATTYSFDLVQWAIGICVPAIAGLIGVWIGSLLAARREQREQRLAFLAKQLEEFYSALLGIRTDIGELAVKNNKDALICAAICLLLIAGCGKFSTWEQFSSPLGGFSVLAPETPKEMKRTVNSAAGPVDVYFFVASQRNTTYMVGYSDYPLSVVQNADPNQISDNGRDGVVANIQGKLLSDLIITLDTHPGREIKVEGLDGKSTLWARIYLVNNRLYQLLVATSKENALTPDSTKFLDSFKLLAP